MSRTMAQVSGSIRMAGVEMPGRKDEGKWDDAKKAAHKAYPELGEENERFWKIVQTIYESMGGT